MNLLLLLYTHSYCILRWWAFLTTVQSSTHGHSRRVTCGFSKIDLSIFRITVTRVHRYFFAFYVVSLSTICVSWSSLPPPSLAVWDYIAREAYNYWSWINQILSFSLHEFCHLLPTTSNSCELWTCKWVCLFFLWINGCSIFWSFASSRGGAF
jgi:hypothetical protein